MRTSPAATETLTRSLVRIERAALPDIPAALAERVTRRIVDNETLAPRLEVAAFNSAT